MDAGNPYKDRLGRFTDKGHAVSPGKKTVPSNPPKIYRFKTENGRMKVTEDIKLKNAKGKRTESVIEAGSEITEVKPFAGDGSDNQFVKSGSLAKLTGSNSGDWSHKTGFAPVTTIDGRVEEREIHWFENDDVGQIGFKFVLEGHWK